MMRKLVIVSTLVATCVSSVYANTTAPTTPTTPTATTATTAAATTSTTTTDSLLARLEKSPVNFRIDTETFNTRRSGQTNVSGYLTNIYTDLSYSFNDSQSVHVYPQLVYSRNDEKPDEVNYTMDDGYVAFRYDQMKILTEDVHGVTFSATGRYYARVSEDARQDYREYGHFNARFYLSKKFNDKFSLNNELRHYSSLTGANYETPGHKRHFQYLYITPKYKLSEKLTAYTEVLTRNYVGRDSAATDTKNDMIVSPGLSYDVSDKVGLGVELGHLIQQSHSAPKSNLDVLVNGTYNFTDKIYGVAQVYTSLYDADGDMNGTYARNNWGMEVDFGIAAF